MYLFKRFVLARKGTADYVAAVFRWSKGAVQLSWTSFWFPLHRYLYPWLVLFLCGAHHGHGHLLPKHKVGPLPPHEALGGQWKKVGVDEEWCRLGPTVGLISDPIFVALRA